MAIGSRVSLVLATGVLAALLPGPAAVSGADRVEQPGPRLTLVSPQTGPGRGWAPTVSGNGRVVGFASVPQTPTTIRGENKSQVFFWERPGARPVGPGAWVGGSTGGPIQSRTSMPVLSRTGRYVVFGCEAADNRATHIYRFDRRTGHARLVDATRDGRGGNGPATAPAVSATGRFVAFESHATDLTRRAPKHAPGPEVYVRDLRRNRTHWVSQGEPAAHGRRGASAPSISADGKVVAFWSRSPLLPADAPNSPDVFVSDLRTGRLTRVPVTGTGAGYEVGHPHVSPNGRYVVFDAAPAGRPASSQIYVFDRHTGQTRPVPVHPFGRGVPSTSRVTAVSYDARYVAFDSNLALGPFLLRSSAFVVDRATGAVAGIAAVGPRTARASAGGLSWDGRFATVQLDKVDPTTGASRPEVYLADLRHAAGPAYPPATRGGIFGARRLVAAAQG